MPTEFYQIQRNGTANPPIRTHIATFYSTMHLIHYRSLLRKRDGISYEEVEV